MTSELLRKARDYERSCAPLIAPQERPAFHMTPAVGWMNDPNGFSVYKGEYHLFYQYNPYATHWDLMHWGHVKTRDFIRWERLPAALAPDMPYDRDGCFSGSAAELPDGRQLLVYTGVCQGRQTQCAAVGDGVDYEKAACNPVIDAADLPPGGSAQDFRDPKVRLDGGRYRMAVANRQADGSGAVLMYESEDGLRWRYAGMPAASGGRLGRMWECPDFFRLDGKDVLLVNPQEMTPVGLEFHAGNCTACVIGTFDPGDCHLSREAVQAVDYGLDFYAPQTLETPDGRRVMIAWMQNWETVAAQPADCRYFGEMTLPRELSVRDGRLIQNPVRELERFRGTQVLHRNVRLSGTASLDGVQGRVLDMTVSVRPAPRAARYRSFRIDVAADAERRVTIRYKPETDTVRIDRTRSGFPHDIVSVRDFPVRPSRGEIRLRLILDRHSLELFVNDGEQAATAMFYTDPRADAIRFTAEGEAEMDVEKYDLIAD